MTAADYQAQYGAKKPAADRMSPSEYREQHVKPKAKKAPKWGAMPKQSESEQKCEGVRLEIKPLSVNRAWKGQRFKSDTYKQYEKAVLLMLPQISLPAPPYRLSLVFGFSNLASDLDNPAKCFIDCMQKAYGFNDKHITELHIKKTLVPKGQEYIEFNILTAE